MFFINRDQKEHQRTENTLLLIFCVIDYTSLLLLTKFLTIPACFLSLLKRANIKSTISKATMKIRLPSNLFGNNVHTTRNMTKSLPAESAAYVSVQGQALGDASQDDTIISTYQEHILPSNVAAPYEDYIDDGSMTTCTNMFAENRTRKVQIYTENCTDSDSDIDLKLPLELLGSSCIDNALDRFEGMSEIDPELPSSGSGESEMDNVNNQSSSSYKDDSDSVPEQELQISNPQQIKRDDTDDSGGSITVVDAHVLDLSSVSQKSEMDNVNDSGGSTCKNEHDSFYSRKDEIICCLLGICFALIGICLFYSHSHITLLSEFNNLERERNQLKFENSMMKSGNNALIDNCYFKIRSGYCTDGLIQSTYDWHNWIMTFFP